MGPHQILCHVCMLQLALQLPNSLPRLVVPNKGYSSLDQSPDEKPLVALDTDRCVWGLGAAGQGHDPMCAQMGLYSHTCHLARVGWSSARNLHE